MIAAYDTPQFDPYLARKNFLDFGVHWNQAGFGGICRLTQISLGSQISCGTGPGNASVYIRF